MPVDRLKNMPGFSIDRVAAAAGDESEAWWASDAHGAGRDGSEAPGPRWAGSGEGRSYPDSNYDAVAGRRGAGV